MVFVLSEEAVRRTGRVAGRVDLLRSCAGMSRLTDHPAGADHHSIGRVDTDVAGVGALRLREA